MHNTKEKAAQFQALMETLDPNGEPQASFAYRAAMPTAPGVRGVVVLDASFNPMTSAHEQLALCSQRSLDLPEVVLMLSRANVDKELFGATLGQRLAMIETYARTRPDFSVAGCSHARFIDKAKALRPHYSPAIPFYFTIGYDTLIRFFDPKYYTDMTAELTPFFSHNHVVAANRGAGDRRAVEAFINRPGCAPFSHRIHIIELPADMGHISSTEVRRRVRAGQPIDDLVPRAISRTISRLNLYIS